MALFKGTIIGNLGKDAELRDYNGKQFLSFTLAVTKKIKEEDKTTWISVTTRQVNLKDYLKKGKQVYMSGDLDVDVYESKPDIRLMADEIQLLGKKEG